MVDFFNKIYAIMLLNIANIRKVSRLMLLSTIAFSHISFCSEEWTSEEYDSQYENQNNNQNRGNHSESENFGTNRTTEDALKNRINSLENKVHNLEKSVRALADTVYNGQTKQKTEETFDESKVESVNLDKMESKPDEDKEKIEKKRLENEEKYKKFNASKAKNLDYGTLVAEFKEINLELTNKDKKTKALAVKNDFEKFILTNANSNKLGDAHFWLAETYYVLINLESNKSSPEAKEYIDNASINYIKSFKEAKSEDKKPSLLFKLAEVSYLKQENEPAIKLLDKIKSDYPKQYKQMLTQITSLREKIAKAKAGTSKNTKPNSVKLTTNKSNEKKKS